MHVFVAMAESLHHLAGAGCRTRSRISSHLHLISRHTPPSRAFPNVDALPGRTHVMVSKTTTEWWEPRARPLSLIMVGGGMPRLVTTLCM